MKQLHGRVTGQASKVLFGASDEHRILSNLLQTPKSMKEFPFVAVFKESAARRSAQKRGLGRSKTPYISRVSFEPSQAALALMTKSSVTSKNLDVFLEENYLGNASPVERLQALDRGLFDLVAASTPNNLRAVMQYLSRFWQCGLFGSRPLISNARNQARFVLQRAIEVHPPTEHANGGEQVGVPDLHKFETFVANFFNYLGVHHTPEDELEELLLQLSSQSGHLAATMTQVLSVAPGTLSEETMEKFLVAFAASKPSRKSVEAIQHVLLHPRTGPAAIRFLVPYTESMNELLDLVESIDQTSPRDDIYAACQFDLLKRLLFLSDNDLGAMFGFLSRIGGPVSAESINLVLRTAVQSGNLSAIKQAAHLGDEAGETVEAALLAQAKKALESLNGASQEV